MKNLLGILFTMMTLHAHAGAVSSFNSSWESVALGLQRDIDTHSPMADNNILGSHNTYNSAVYSDINSYYDPQQKHSIYDQLELGARFIELDIHWTAHTHGWPWQWGDDLLLCHSGIGAEIGSLHVGCSLTDRFVRDGFNEVANWLKQEKNKDEVIILYLEDHTDGHHEELGDLLASTLLPYIYESGGCGDIPNTLSKADVLAESKQIVLWKDGGCSSNDLVSSYAFTGLGDISRVWEDRTAIAAIAELFLIGEPVGRITATEVAELFASGVNLVNLDNLTFDDGRIGAAIWSWGEGEPNNVGGEDCASIRSDGRWNDLSCSSHLAFACFNPSTKVWAISSHQSGWRSSDGVCNDVGTGFVFSTPTNSKDNAQLLAVKQAVGAAGVWLNYNDKDVEGEWRVNGVQVAKEIREEADLFRASEITDFGLGSSSPLLLGILLAFVYRRRIK